MNNKAHLRPKDFDSNGDIIPMSMKEEKGDLISRKWLTDAIRNRKTYLSYEDAKDVIDLIDSAPSVYDNPYSDGREDGYIEGYEEAKRESDRPKGKWINTSPYDDKGECSLCCYLSKKYYKFCPNCGAEMKGGAE